MRVGNQSQIMRLHAGVSVCVLCLDTIFFFSAGRWVGPNWPDEKSDTPWIYKYGCLSFFFDSIPIWGERKWETKWMRKRKEGNEKKGKIRRVIDISPSGPSGDSLPDARGKRTNDWIEGGLVCSPRNESTSHRCTKTGTDWINSPDLLCASGLESFGVLPECEADPNREGHWWIRDVERKARKRRDCVGFKRVKRKESIGLLEINRAQ